MSGKAVSVSVSAPAPIELAPPIQPAAVNPPVRRTRGRPRLHPGAYAMLVVLVFGATIGIGASLGAWQVSGRTSGNGAPVVPQGTDAAEIKGWMAIGDVAAAWSVPLPEMLAAFDLPADTAPTTALKDLESDTFSVTALRDWLEGRGTTPSPEATAGGAESAASPSTGSASATPPRTPNPSRSLDPNATKHPSGSGHPRASASASVAPAP